MSDNETELVVTEPSPGNRVGLRHGKVSELTVIVPLKPGGAARLKKFIDSRNGDFTATDRVGTVHFMRFVFIDNDTRLLFCTSFDGDWDSYIDDFGTKIPDELDALFSEAVDYPGIKSPTIKDYIAKYQITAAGWYSAYPDQTVQDVLHNAKVAAATENLLDAVES